ncbi:protein of unassigned function [Methylobacterium oryzae CBMB20]|uniref:Protein of unassigned function n=1 Tax=Methylobacterium oryzae CBMB20 TaxID=693986 RepID=A0A089P0M7_9HYPH|nr:protein of unassigned function [Methylobacterium oryzae CBMB20]
MASSAKIGRYQIKGAQRTSPEIEIYVEESSGRVDLSRSCDRSHGLHRDGWTDDG